MTDTPVYLPLGFVAGCPRSGHRVHAIRIDTRLSKTSLCGKRFTGIVDRLDRRRASITCADCHRQLRKEQPPS